MKDFKFLPYILIFIGTFLILQLFQGPQGGDPILSQGDLGMDMAKSQYSIGKDIKLELQNNTAETIEIAWTCPGTPFQVMRYTSQDYEAVTNTNEATCVEQDPIVIEPGKKETVSLLDYTYTFFGEIGRYKVVYQMDEDTSFSTPEFTVKEPSVITRLWRNLIYKPILNALVAIIIYLPGHSLWLSIVALTIVIRTILLYPSAQAIKSQRAMQEVQPKIEQLKKKYKDDQARLAQETMALWKKHKVHPLSSCLPMLVQFPILIALFYVIQSGLNPDKAVMIYEFLPAFSLADIDPTFFMFDLFERSIIIFPVVIGGLQFLQMHLMLALKKDKKDKKSSGPKEVEQMNKIMRFMMPIMIAFFTAQLPAAVGLYWGTSTFYGVLQQLVLNRKGSSLSASSTKDEVSVRVINKKTKKSNGKTT